MGSDDGLQEQEEFEIETEQDRQDDEVEGYEEEEEPVNAEVEVEVGLTPELEVRLNLLSHRVSTLLTRLSFQSTRSASPTISVASELSRKRSVRRRRLPSRHLPELTLLHCRNRHGNASKRF